MMTQSELFNHIMERAEEDSGYAIAYALLELTIELKWLGHGDAVPTMGALEFVAVKLGELASAVNNIAEGQQ